MCKNNLSGNDLRPADCVFLVVLPLLKVEFPLIRLKQPNFWRIPMTKTRRKFTAEQKDAIVRRHLKGKESISSIAEELSRIYHFREL
jgi:hypothetical protein